MTPIIFRTVLGICFLLFFFAAMLWPSYKVWKQTGINPYQFGKNDTAHDFIGRLFRLTVAGCAGVLLLAIFLPTTYLYLAVIPWLDQPIFAWTGLLLLIVSIIWVVIAQQNMGASWRVGIDEKNKTALVGRGLFLFSRNPIFLGMRIMLLGFFLALPNALTFGLFLLGDTLMQIQARLEEAYLSEKHGAAYLAYCQRVRRWI